MRVEALVVVSGKEKTDDDTRENEPCSAIVSLVGNKHRLPSTALAPNESQLPPSAYRFGSFPRVECEPSALWNTRSLLQVRYEGGVKRENDGSGVSMLSSFSLSCFLDALSLDLGISKKKLKPALRRPWPLREAAAAPEEEETADDISSSSSRSSSNTPRSRPPRLRESQLLLLLPPPPLPLPLLKNGNNSSSTAKTPTTLSPRSRRSSRSSPRTHTTAP